MRNKYLLFLFIFFLLFYSSNLFAQTKELDIYTEWYSKNCLYESDRPYFFIKDMINMKKFWEKANIDEKIPHIDFEKFMVFVWLPGYSRRDLSDVYFESLVYKEGCLQVLIDFAEDIKKYTQGGRPAKIAIFPYVKPCDVFIFKKVKKGKKKYEWKPIYALWDMSSKRNRPFEYVLADQPPEEPVIQLATYDDLIEKKDQKDSSDKKESKEEVRETNKQSSVSPVKIVYVPTQNNRPKTDYSIKPRVQPSQPISSKPQPVVNQQQVQPQIKQQPIKPSGSTKDSPISIGGTTASTDTPKPQTTPGMGEDPLFGSEFDITF